MTQARRAALGTCLLYVVAALRIAKSFQDMPWHALPHIMGTNTGAHEIMGT